MLKAGDSAPDFDLQDSAGSPVRLRELLRGGPVLVAFFKSSCPVCQYTFPYLERLAGSEKLTVLGVSQDEWPATSRFSRDFGLSFPMARDDGGRGYPVSNAYRITHVPSLFLVEPNGSIGLAVSGFSRSELHDLGARFGAAVFRKGETTPEFKPG